MNLFNKLVDWVFPRHCYLCATLLTEQEAICPECQLTLPWNIRACHRCALPIAADGQCGACLINPPAFAHCIAPFLYEPPISTLIIQLKFQQKLHCARILGGLLLESIRHQSLELPEYIIPVPLHSRRIRERGFNQAIEIARPLSKALKIPVLLDSCYRRKNTLPQSQLSARGRRRNLAAAFGMAKSLPFQHVAIIDDVMTTGQTVRVLSQMLQQQGIQRIDVWCCARAVV